MPTKTKEINGENTEKAIVSKSTEKKPTTSKKVVSKTNKDEEKVTIKTTTKPEKKEVATTKTTVAKKSETSAKTSASVAKKSGTSAKTSASVAKKSETPEKASASTQKKLAVKTVKKSSTAKSVAKNTSVKKSVAKKETASTPKKAVSVTKTVKKSSTTKSTAKKSTTKKTTTSKVAKLEKPLAEVVEYYDLPYRYNETIVKILYQTPDTLFVYWDIADSDRENYIKQYGENFFNITRPVLIVHNDTMNYSFEIPINDFANSWYLHINDSKCDYRVELGRRPNYYSAEAAKEIKEKIHTDYIYVSTSNEIESPNDHVLFNTNENNTIRVRNVKNHNEKSISLYELVKRLPAMKRVQNIPYISEELLKNLYSGIYENEDISLFEKLTNPSSAGNPSSGSMSSRFI